ncbi:hypothetical protein [Flammeovirga agarivorans]|uniref:Uncharacterized protein n=1 Tax=Flammeovirga agarivorans TaxID=2726742 RepID=A0A7X8SRE5_9BACT|nr:hypothetical protein [Flammeovirga agarivorans]NLR95021.1 hypothetical protein [Flammeovirga agarivorans]
MIRITFILITLLFSRVNTYCQDDSCAEYYGEFCEYIKLDSTEIPFYTSEFSPSDYNQDSTSVSFSDCIDNHEAFCSGVSQALKEDKLSIRQVGDPGHVSSCTYASFENYDVSLILTGDIIEDRGIFIENAGYNFVMKRRIQDSLGVEVLQNIGKRDSSWIEFDNNQMQNLIATFEIEFKTDSTIFLKVNNLRMQQIEFKSLEGVIFTDAMSKYTFSYNNLLEGIEMKTLGDRNRKAYLVIDFEGYTNPNFCKSRINNKWIIPIKIDL